MENQRQTGPLALSLDAEGLELKPGKGWSPGAQSLLTEEERAKIDRYCLMDDWGFIDSEPPDSRSPSEFTMTERAALRILCKQHRWIAIRPGCLVKGRTMEVAL